MRLGAFPRGSRELEGMIRELYLNIGCILGVNITK